MKFFLVCLDNVLIMNRLKFDPLLLVVAKSRFVNELEQKVMFLLEQSRLSLLFSNCNSNKKHRSMLT